MAKKKAASKATPPEPKRPPTIYDELPLVGNRLGPKLNQVSHAIIDWNDWFDSLPLVLPVSIEVEKYEFGLCRHNSSWKLYYCLPMKEARNNLEDANIEIKAMLLPHVMQLSHELFAKLSKLDAEILIFPAPKVQEDD